MFDALEHEAGAAYIDPASLRMQALDQTIDHPEQRRDTDFRGRVLGGETRPRSVGSSTASSSAPSGEMLGLGACQTSKIMFTRLNPGREIPTHVDENASSLVPHKIHVPLITNPDVIFHIDGKPYHLPAGRAYELNNHLPHSVHNPSDRVRIHFIFDCYPVVP